MVAIIYQSPDLAIGDVAQLAAYGAGVTGVLAKGVVLEGEAGMLLFQGIHLVEEQLVLVLQASHSLATLEGINFMVIPVGPV